MAADDSDDDGFLRTVTPLADLHPNQEMDVIGWVMFITMAVLLLPLLPVLLLVWIVSKLVGR